MTIRRLILFCFLLSISPHLNAQEVEQKSGENVSSVLFEHILDSHEITLLPFTPPLHLPFGITVHLLMMFIAVIVIVVFGFLAIRKSSSKPKGTTNALEFIVLFVQNDIVFPVMGKKRGEKWLAFFVTIFLFILVLNFIGLIPAFKASTGNFTVTSSLAIMIFLLIFVIGIKNLGPIKFFTNLYPAGSPVPIGIFVAFLEFVSTLIKSAVLSLRLFANMFAGHLAILSFVVLMVILGPGISPVSVIFGLFTYALEVLVALIQAFVFTLLSCIFITTASSSHEHE